MGVKLENIIIKKKIEISDLSGKIIAIDAPNIIFSLFNVSFKNLVEATQNLMVDRTQRVISHLYGILYRVNFFYSKNILPIFCFDGRVSKLKRVITKDQLNDFRYIRALYKNAINCNNFNEARKIALSKEFLWPNTIFESKRLLSTLGVPYIESPGAAEAQCAHLVKLKIADYSNSQDYDSLLFGCPHVVQNLSKSQRRKVQGKWSYKKVQPVIISLQQNLDYLSIDLFQLIDMSILIGCDYFPGIRNIGPKTALKLINKHKMLEQIVIEERKNYDFSTLSDKRIQAVRKLFLLPDVLESINNLYWNPPQISQVIDFLCKDHHLNLERVSNNVEKLSENFYRCISSFEDKRTSPSLIQKTFDELF